MYNLDFHRRNFADDRCQSTKTKEPKTRNLLDNASNLLTNLLSGGNLGSMPIAEGAVTDLFDRPLFFSLYDWFIQVFIYNNRSQILFIFLLGRFLQICLLNFNWYSENSGPCLLVFWSFHSVNSYIFVHKNVYSC